MLIELLVVGLHAIVEYKMKNAFVIMWSIFDGNHARDYYHIHRVCNDKNDDGARYIGLHNH